MRPFPGKLPLLAASLSLALTGCGGGSSSSSSDDPAGTPTTSLSCSTQVTMASNDEGFDNNAGYLGLHYYALGDRLCAFDPEAGTAFEVENLSGQTIDPVVTIYEKDSTSDLSVRGVVYPRGNELFFAQAGDSSAGVPPSPRPISSASNADEIDMLLTGFDRNGSDGVSIAYRIPDFDAGSTAWFNARLSDNSTTDPTAFNEFQRPLGPVNDNSGALVGWLAHHFETDSSGEVVMDAFVLVDANDASEEIPGLQGGDGLDTIAGIGVNYLAQLDNGDVVLRVVRNDETEFYYLDVDAQTITTPGSIPAETGGFDTVYGTSGEALYVALTIPNEGAEPEDEARLYRINNNARTLLDSAEVADTFPVQVTATDSGVVWAWNSNLSGSGPSGVYLVDESSGDEVSPILENADLDNELTFSSLARGAGGHNVFFTESNTSTGSDFTAYAVDTVNPATPAFRVERANAQWVASSQPGDSLGRAGVVPPPQVSEVFLVENDEGTQRLFAHDAQNPDESVALGTLDFDFSLPMGIPIAPVATPFGLGPYRLMFLVKSEDELFIVDTRHSNSARTLAEQQDGSPSFRLFGGF